jgi:hypothetical protein
MNKEFIPYEPALALKELGFNEPCLSYYFSDGIFNDASEEDDILYPGDPRFHSDTNSSLSEYLEDELKYNAIAAPLYQQAFRWFREKYSLVHEISWSKYKGGLNFDYDVFSLVLPTDDELGDEDDIASDKSMETYDSLVDKDFRHHESNTYEEAELACLNKLIEIAKNK